MSNILLTGPTKLAAEQSSADRFILEAEKLRRSKLPLELVILTCYFSPNPVLTFLQRLQRTVPVTKAWIAFSASEYLRIGRETIDAELGKVSAAFPSVQFKAIAGPKGELVHAKGYALLKMRNQGTEQETVAGGFAMVTSSNFTQSGFFQSNIEIVSVTEGLEDLIAFNSLFTEMWNDFPNTSKPMPKQAARALFPYELLCAGRFLSKTGNYLKAVLPLRYRLTEEAKEKVTADASLLAIGYELDKESISKNYIRYDDLVDEVFPPRFRRNYTAETHLGSFCPAPIWNIAVDEMAQSADGFIGRFRSKTSEQVLKRLASEAKHAFEALAGFVLEEEDHIDRWLNRIRAIRDNEIQLQRAHRVFYDFSLPYQLEDEDEIEVVYESLRETIASAKSRNLAKQLVGQAMSTRSLKEYSIADTAKRDLRAMFRRQRANR